MKNTLKKYYKLSFIIFLLLSINIIKSQDSISVIDLMDKIVRDEYKALPFANNLDYLSNNKLNLPFLKDVGFRTETKDMDLKSQEYQLRFEFNSRGERKAIKEKYKLIKTQYKIKQQLSLSKKIKEMNTDIINLYSVINEIELQNRELNVLLDKKSIYEKLIQSKANVDFSKWFSNDEAITVLKSNIKKSKNTKHFILKKFFRKDTNLVINKLDKIISIKEILSIIKNIKDNYNYSGPNFELLKNNQSIIEIKRLYEKAKASKLLDYLQLKYQNNEKLPFLNELSIGASIAIPYKAKNRMKKNELTLEMLDNKYKTQILMEKILDDIENLYLDINTLADKFASLSENDKILEFINKYKGVMNPIDLLNLKLKEFEKQKSKNDLKKLIYLKYIEFISITGNLGQKPLRNYLLTPYILFKIDV